jgi:hypothetical protein
MIQKNIRDWGGTPYSNAEADELTQELNDRTISSQDGYNSVDELATKMKSAETSITAKEDKASKGVANGYAELGADGKVPAAQLPAGTDEVQEYANVAAFPATGSSSVIYVALDTNVTYRWGGTVYVEISASLALGETSTTAYRGDRGKIAYDHSQSAHAPSDAEANQTDAEIKTQYEANANTNAFTDALQTKLNQIEANATADQTGAEIKVAYEAEADTNAYTDAEKTKLAGIEANATADQTGAEIKALYEAESNTNAFTDAEKAKLALQSGTNTGDQDLSNYPTLTGENTFTNQNVFQGSIVNYTGDNTVSGGTEILGNGNGRAHVITGLEESIQIQTTNNIGNANIFSLKADGATAADDVIRMEDGDARYVKSTVTGEPTGADRVINIVSLTQAEYDAGTPVATTFYIITDA